MGKTTEAFDEFFCSGKIAANGWKKADINVIIVGKEGRKGKSSVPAWQ